MFAVFDRWTSAWPLACTVFAIHLAEETLHGSFGFYADILSLVGSFFPSLDMPPFDRDVWFINLLGSLAVLIALTPLVRARNALMRPASWLFGLFLAANGAMHLWLGLATQALVPGIWSAPLVLLAGLWLLVVATGRTAQAGPAAA